MRFEDILLIKGFFLIFFSMLVLIASAFFPGFITNHLKFYSAFLVLFLIGLLMINFGKKLLNR